ncbi:hypothetical protein Tco_0758640, partial [Tanacetum coccineum]
YDEDVHDLGSVETEFLAIIFNDNLTSNETLSCEPTVSSLNDNEIDFRISFDKSDDEDYAVVYDENSFSYKIISVNNLKTDSENDNEKVNMPSFLSSKPEVSYFNDLDFYKDFENEFPAIVYNDALTSRSDLLTEPTISHRHINEFDLKDETSLSEYTNNDNDKIDIEQPSGDMSVIPSPNVINVDTQGSNKLLETMLAGRQPGMNYLSVIESVFPDYPYGVLLYVEDIALCLVKICNVMDDWELGTVTGIRQLSNYGVLGEDYLKGMHFGALMKSSRKSTDLTANTLYYSRPIRQYIMLEEKKARRRGKVYNWETTTYGKIWDNEDVYDLGSVETEFPAIVFNNIISFDESDDEDYTVIYEKNSFSYKIISVNDLKMDSENDNDKVNMPSFLSHEPKFSYFDELDFFNDFENEFPAIVYNDALTSKLDFLTEPIVSPQHIDEFNLKDEISLSECDEEEQNVLNFNDLFSFNVIYPNDSKSDKDNDDDKVDIEHSSGDLFVKQLPDVINTDIGAYARGCGGLGCRAMVLDTMGGCHGCFELKGVHVASILAMGLFKQSTLPTKEMRSIISKVSISLKDFLPSILLLMVIIVAVVIVTVIWVVIFVNVIVGVIIVVAIIRVVVVVGVPSIIDLSFMIVGFLHRITLYYLVH